MLLMFVLTPADSLCCAWFIYPILCLSWCLEVGLALSIGPNRVGFHLKMALESNLQNDACLNKKRITHNVQKHSNCINIQLSQTFSSYLNTCLDNLCSGYLISSQNLESKCNKTKDIFEGAQKKLA
jgi:hypothetical protein